MVLKYIRKLFRQMIEEEESTLPPLTPLPPLPAGAQPVTRGPDIVHRPIAKNLIDPDVVKIIHRLTRFGHKAYLVGGGVRDLLLHRTPKDFDIGTSAQPQDVKKLFRNCRIIGRRFRLAHIFFRDKIIEVATFRANVAGDEGAGGGDLLIRSDNVFGDPQTDALRRDFTINALFYEEDSGNVIDYVGGLADLDAGILRTIGDPDIRLREDPIRILRALRLAGRLGFAIDEKTLRAIRAHREDIRKAAVPRVLEDLLRMLRGSGAERGFRLMEETGVLEVVLPELHEALAAGRMREAAAGLDVTTAFWKMLHAIDLATARGTEFSNPTLFAALLYPRAAPVLSSQPADSAIDHPHGQEPGAADLSRALDAALSRIEQRLNVPRRDRDRLRQLLLAQRRFAGGRKGRRFSASAFISRPFFPEAFDLFEILCSATGQHREELRKWRERIAAVAAQRGGGPLYSVREEAGREAGRERGKEGGRERGGQGGREVGREGGRERGGQGGREAGREGGPERGTRGGRRRPGGGGGAGDEKRRRERDRDREAPAASARGSVFPAEEPERPELTDEDVALVYGTVLTPEVGASAVPAPGRHPLGSGRPARDQRPGGRSGRPGRWDGAKAGQGRAGRGDARATGGSPGAGRGGSGAAGGAAAGGGAAGGGRGDARQAGVRTGQAREGASPEGTTDAGGSEEGEGRRGAGAAPGEATQAAQGRRRRRRRGGRKHRRGGSQPGSASGPQSGSQPGGNDQTLTSNHVDTGEDPR